MLFDINDTEKLKPGTIKKALTVYQKYMEKVEDCSRTAEERFINNLTPLMKCFNDREFGDAIEILDSMRSELLCLLMCDDEDFELGEIDRILYSDDDSTEDSAGAYISTIDEDDIDDIF